jgi:hypothetical protein
MTGPKPPQREAGRPGTWPVSAFDIEDDPAPQPDDVIEDLGVVRDRMPVSTAEDARKAGFGIEVDDEGRSEVGVGRTVWMDVQGEGGGGTVADWLAWRRKAMAISPTVISPSLGGERDELAEAQADHDRLIRLSGPQLDRLAEQAAATVPPFPIYTGWLNIAEGDADSVGAGLYQATVTGPAAFVERSLAATLDAFREHTER